MPPPRPDALRPDIDRHLDRVLQGYDTEQK
jgi:hypothetical protein